MKKLAWLCAFIALGLPLFAHADGWRKDSSALDALNKRLIGQVVDYTDNHGVDNRMWSKALGQKRDLYVYLPPNYCKDYRYPIVMFLHGFAEDEQVFLKVVDKIDAAIATGTLPPLIIAAPDGSIPGEPCYTQPATFFLNSRAGDFEDFVLQDVWDFVACRYPFRCEREAHVLAGASMGGFAAFNLGIRHRNAFGVALGIFPPVNLRWMDDQNNYFGNFDPAHWGWRRTMHDYHENVASYYGGTVQLRLQKFVEPVFGWGDWVVEDLARVNPIELVDRTCLRDGELSMFIGYGGKDEFNVDAQVESFLYFTKCRGVKVDVAYDPNGHHDMATAQRLLPNALEWLGCKLGMYCPLPATPVVMPMEIAPPPQLQRTSAAVLSRKST